MPPRGRNKNEPLTYQEMIDAAERDAKRRPPLPPSKAPASFKILDDKDDPLRNKPHGLPHGHSENMSYIAEKYSRSDRPLYFQWRDKYKPAVRKDYELNKPQKYMWWAAKTYLRKNVWYYRDR